MEDAGVPPQEVMSSVVADVAPAGPSAGHLLSTAEVESALVEHEAVAEAAVVGRPHPIKGESLYCFVTLIQGVTYSRALEAELRKQGGCSAAQTNNPLLRSPAPNRLSSNHLSFELCSKGEDRRHRHAGLHPERSRTPQDPIWYGAPIQTGTEMSWWSVPATV